VASRPNINDLSWDDERNVGFQLRGAESLSDLAPMHS
jgi:hypothetical protein